MAGNDKRARDQDRDQAIEVVEAAWADGQIVEADRDKRVESLLQAQTMAEVQMLTHDLQLPKTPPPPAPYGQAEVEVDTPVPVATTRRAGSSKALWLLLLLIPIGLVIGVIAIIAAIVSGVSSATDEDDLPLTPGADPGRGEVNVLSADGFADLVAALEEETGSSTVFEAVLYPGYAVVGVPVDPTSEREHSFYWDGDLEETGTKTTTGYTRFDLADIDPDVVVSVVDQARAKVENPQSWYSIVRAPGESDNDTWIWGYATNEYGESGYLGSDKAGTITWDPDGS